MTLPQRLELAAARAALFLLRGLGPVAASNIGGFVARMVGPFLPASRIADVNLRLCLPELDVAARRRIVRAVWDNLGRTVGEFPHLSRLPLDAPTGPGWRVEGRAHVEALAAAGGPAVFVTAHFGNWEMLPPACARFGAPPSSFFRPTGSAGMDALIAGLRADAAGPGVAYFPKGREGAVQALGHLRRRGFLGALFDQKMNDGIEARLFGRAAMTAPALARLALRLRCPVMPLYVRREGPARLVVTYEPALPLPDTGDKATDTLALTQAVNDRLEAWVRAYPGHWLWLHRRFEKGLYSRPLADRAATQP